MKTKLAIIVLSLIVGGMTVGTALAEVFNEPVTVNDNLTINDGTFKSTRTDNTQTAFKLVHDTKQMSFIFDDTDDPSQYTLRVTTGTGGKFTLSETTGTARDDLTIKKSNGFVGLGSVSNPQEQLEINGNILLSGTDAKITSNGDICIGSGC